ncbi:hypothetical protein AAA214_03515, partial [Parabacteroides goldsteinii]|uniref:hypothetical protein n=1 Tax=Parabacteroides goldsteinii TaxID=328812 RepID=UPI0032C07A8A
RAHRRGDLHRRYREEPASRCQRTDPRRLPRAGDMERKRLPLHPPAGRPAVVARPHLYAGGSPARQLPFNPGVDASAIADGDLYRTGWGDGTKGGGKS